MIFVGNAAGYGQGDADGRIEDIAFCIQRVIPRGAHLYKFGDLRIGHQTVVIHQIPGGGGNTGDGRGGQVAVFFAKNDRHRIHSGAAIGVKTDRVGVGGILRHKGEIFQGHGHSFGIALPSDQRIARFAESVLKNLIGGNGNDLAVFKFLFIRALSFGGKGYHISFVNGNLTLGHVARFVGGGDDVRSVVGHDCVLVPIGGVGNVLAVEFNFEQVVVGDLKDCIAVVGTAILNSVDNGGGAVQHHTV